MQTHQGHANINGTLLYYEIAGSGSPLVLIHGFSLDTRMWDQQFALFAQHYQVLRYDARGFGQSGLPTTEPYNHAEDLHALLLHLGLDQVAVLGLSIGGTIAVNFALAYPAATTALIPVASGLDGYEMTELPLMPIIETANRDGLQAAKAQWLSHPLLQPAQDNPALVRQLSQMLETYSGWHFLNYNYGESSEPPAIERLDTISVPTLVIDGAQDTLDCRRMADILARDIPAATQVMLPGVGHIVNVEAPDRFNKIVLDFLAEHVA